MLYNGFESCECECECVYVQIYGKLGIQLLNGSTKLQYMTLHLIFLSFLQEKYSNKRREDSKHQAFLSLDKQFSSIIHLIKSKAAEIRRLQICVSFLLPGFLTNHTHISGYNDLSICPNNCTPACCINQSILCQ